MGPNSLNGVFLTFVTVFSAAIWTNNPKDSNAESPAVTKANAELVHGSPLGSFPLDPNFYNLRSNVPAAGGKLEFIRVSEDGTRFVRIRSGSTFRVWGVNYDHDRCGRLIEDYWKEEWPTVVEDLEEIKALGANVVRIHLQVGRFMESPQKPNEAALGQLERLVELARRTGLYLDITGLGCYHKNEVPEWYDSMGEAARWEVQTLFWEAVAETCSGSSAVFCYDLMNEPVLPGGDKKETEWLAGEFGGKHFVQRIALDLAGRKRNKVAEAWVERLVSAIRKHDTRHMITVGVIPWAHVWPKAKPVFYCKEAGDNLDFVSVHFYPKKGEVGKALKALKVYDVGRPVVVEEMFPLKCSVDELEAFIKGSKDIAAGWMSFYWGKTIEEYSEEADNMRASIKRRWLEHFQRLAPEILGPGSRSAQPEDSGGAR